MNKKYSKPQITVASLTTQPILTSSTLTGQQDYDKLNINFSDTNYDGEGASRYLNVWDDEDDDFDF